MKKNNYIDLATDLHNKNFLIDNTNSFIEQIITDSKNEISWALMFGDINGLKKLNDTHGHQISNEGISAIAKIIKDNIRIGIPRNNEKENRNNNDGDKLIHKYPIRYGGDEFLILLSNCTKEQARIVKYRIKNEINKNVDLTKGLTLSIGVSDTNEVKNTEDIITNLINLAESRMYKNKEKYYKNFPFETKLEASTEEIYSTVDKYYTIKKKKEVLNITSKTLKALLEENIITSNPNEEKKLIKKREDQ